MDLDKLTKKQLQKHLNKITNDKFPKGNSKFKCEKHNKILEYLEIVSGCSWCIYDDAYDLNKNAKNGED